VIVQKYVHDLVAWEALPVSDQERAIGRTKLDDVEFPDEDTAPDAHVKLNTIVDEDGEEQQIVRVNMPFGEVGTAEFGTYFIGYARTPATRTSSAPTFSTAAATDASSVTSSRTNSAPS
jgi:putative iron-dependent peroxidase